MIFVIPSGKRGFTLIELLVVVGIIAVLLSILIPALAAARGRARAAVCLSNARQLVTAVAAFGSSNGGRLPENRTKVAPTEHVTWRANFVKNGYAPEGKAWTCPDHPNPGPLNEIGVRDDAGTTCVDDVKSSYALNGHLLWRSSIEDKEALRAETAIQRPSHTALIVETRAQFPDMRVTNFLVAQDDGVGGAYGFWHKGKGTYGFADGHAEQLGFLTTGSPDCRWHNGRDLAQDSITPQDPSETRIHAHPDWEFLVPKVYLQVR